MVGGHNFTYKHLMKTRIVFGDVCTVLEDSLKTNDVTILNNI